MRDPPGEVADRLESLRPLQAMLALDACSLGVGLASDIDERDDHVRDRVADRPRVRTDVDLGAIGPVDRDVVDDHDLALGQRAHERHPVLGIELPTTGVDAVRLRVFADLDVVARPHSHDLTERPVRVHQLAIRRARHPQPHRQLLAQRQDDLLVGRHDIPV